MPHSDITKQKQVEKVLRERIRRLLDSQKIAKVGEWTLDLSSNKLYWSDEIYKLFEIDPKQFQASYEAFLNAIHPDDREELNLAYSESLKTKQPYEIIHRLLMTDGRIKFVKENCRNEYDVNGKPLRSIGTIQDITTLKETEVTLQNAKLEAERASQAKSEFLANMSHEIRTPMNAVLGFTEILKGMENDPAKSHYIENIHTSGHALLHLINDILDLSKIEAGKLELIYSPSSLRELFGEMDVIFKNQIIDKGLKFMVECDDTVPKSLLLDETRLRQVMINLIGNAMKFTESGSIRLTASAINNTKNESITDLVIYVEDTGVGIASEQQAGIFEAFEQLSNQSVQQSGGTGLGLAISRSLTAIMGGELSVKSNVGEGATFKISIPDVTITEAESATQNRVNTLNLDTIDFEPATILIADDIAYNREMLTIYLNTWDFKLIYATNGLEVLEQTRANQPDLILLDMKMPKMSGYEAARLLNKDEKLKEIPIIAVTASALKRDESVINQLCDGYLRKPVSRLSLVSQLTNFLKYSDTSEITPNTEKTGSDLKRELLSAEILNSYPDLLQKLSGKIHRAKELVEFLLVGEIEEFSHDIQQLAKQYQCPLLDNWAELTAAAAQEFDIDKIKLMMKQFLTAVRIPESNLPV